LSPRARIECTNCSPKPEEQPVINQTSWEGISSDGNGSVEVRRSCCRTFGKKNEERLCCDSCYSSILLYSLLVPASATIPVVHVRCNFDSFYMGVTSVHGCLYCLHTTWKILSK
jgi:hypothetical protein